MGRVLTITRIFGATFFWFIRRYVLQSATPYEWLVTIYPVTMFLAVGLNLFMVLYKADKNNPQVNKWGLAVNIPYVFGIVGILAILFHFFAVSQSDANNANRVIFIASMPTVLGEGRDPITLLRCNIGVGGIYLCSVINQLLVARAERAGKLDYFHYVLRL